MSAKWVDRQQLAGLAAPPGEQPSSEERLRFALDAMPGLVSYISPDRVYMLMNRAYEEWYGTPVEALVNRAVREVVGEAAYQAVSAYIDTVLTGQRVDWDGQVLLPRLGERHVRASYLPDLGPNGEVRGFVALVHDITNQKDTEQRVADEVRTKEGLARVGTSLVELDLEAIVRRLTDEARALCRAELGAFFYNVTDERGQSMMLYTVSGAPREAFSKFPHPRRTLLFEPTLNGQSVVRCDDVTRDPRFGKNAPFHGMPEGHLPVRSYMALPVVSRSGQVHGALLFGHQQPGIFKERDELTLRAVAAHAAVAIDNAQLHAATMAAERKYRALAESMPLLVWTAYPTGRLEYVNQRFLGYAGRTLEQLQEERATGNFIHPSDQVRFTELWQSALESGQPFEMEYRLRGADGRYRWFLARGVPVFDQQGTVVRWVGSGTDIDDRKRNEETQRLLAEVGAALASSTHYTLILRELAKLAVPTLADVCLIDLVAQEGGVQNVASSANEAEQWLTGKSFPYRGRLLTRSELVQHVLQSGQSASLDPEAALRAKEEEALSWLVVPMRAQQRTVGAITLVSFHSSFHFELRDQRAAEELARRAGALVENARLFELAQLERQRAEEASRAKDLFMSTLSHELRTPLTAILGWTRMLQSTTLTPERQEKALATIERNARVQAAMIEDVLDLARITSGKLRLQVGAVDIEQVVEAALDTVRPTADAKGVTLQAVLHANVGGVHGDAPRLQQIVWNLLSNAIKFTPRGGRVHVLLRTIESWIELVVSDSGVGIPGEFLPHVFERFSQADPSRTRQHGGLGLGLAIVKHLTELHGGTVSADSRGLGQGATFTLRLPVSPVRELPASQPDLTDSRAGRLLCPTELSGKRILVVDDEADARELLQSVLESCNVEVVLARSANEAFELLRRERPHLVVSDIGMPDEDGYSLIRRIRQLPKHEGGGTPAVALTAYAHGSDRTRALMAGFQNHLSKPAEPQELIAAVAALIGHEVG